MYVGWLPCILGLREVLLICTRIVSFLPRDALQCKARSCDHISSVCPSVCPSVTLVDHDHIGWKSWKLIARTISPTSSLLVAQRSSTYSQGNMEKFWGGNVRSTPTSIMSDWIESSSTKCHVILSGSLAAGFLFTFVVASRSNVCDSRAFWYYINLW